MKDTISRPLSNDVKKKKLLKESETSISVVYSAYYAAGNAAKVWTVSGGGGPGTGKKR